MIYDIVNTVVYVVLAQLFCSAFVERENSSLRFQMLITVIWMASSIGISFILEDFLIIRIVTVILLNFAFYCVLYKKNRIAKTIALSILFYVLVFACDACVLAIDKIFDPDLKLQTVMDNEYVVYLGVVSQLIQLAAVFIIRRVFLKTKEAEIVSKLWVIYAVIPVYSLSLIVLLCYFSFDGPITSSQARVFTYMASSLLLINLGIYWFISQESKRVLENQKAEIEKENAQGVVQLYDQISNERDILGKREHEYKNMITALKSLCAAKNYEKMEEVLATQNAELINHSNVFETGHCLVNSILNTKYAEAREKGITFRFKIGDLSTLQIEDRDCIVILSNMLNNAIEALQKCKDVKKTISMKAVIEDGQFIFACRNPYAGAIDSDFRSEKEDVVPHGYGLTNIKEAARRYNGDFFFEKKNREFVAVVYIPQKLPNLPKID